MSIIKWFPLWIVCVLSAGPQDPVVSVTAPVDTAPVRHGGDAADDPAIWVDPVEPGKSLILSDDKGGGLCVYGLDGRTP